MAKERFAKAYRHPVLDERLTKQRCRMEGRLLQKCRANGLAVPDVWRVEAPVLYLEFVDGATVRNLLQGWIEGQKGDDDDNDDDDEAEDAAQQQQQRQVAHVGRLMGTLIGQLHGLGIIHGDLTTSNMMVRRQDEALFGDVSEKEGEDKNNNPTILLIDFGLAKNSTSDEDRAVDLYVLERALASTHPSLPETFMDDTILPAYAQAAAATKSEKVLQRLEQVRMRGRKRECFG